MIEEETTKPTAAMRRANLGSGSLEDKSLEEEPVISATDKKNAM